MVRLVNELLTTQITIILNIPFLNMVWYITYNLYNHVN